MTIRDQNKMLTEQLKDITEMYLELLHAHDKLLEMFETAPRHIERTKMVFSQTEDGGIIVSKESM